MTGQYADDWNIQAWIRTQKLYSVEPDLEASVDPFLSLTGDEHLLGVGTGPGDVPAQLAAGGHRDRLVGIDQSEGIVAAARTTHGGMGYRQAEASFDVPNVPVALAKFRRVVRLGELFLAVTNAGSGAPASMTGAIGANSGRRWTRQRSTNQPCCCQITEAFSEVNDEVWGRRSFQAWDRYWPIWGPCPPDYGLPTTSRRGARWRCATPSGSARGRSPSGWR